MAGETADGASLAAKAVAVSAATLLCFLLAGIVAIGVQLARGHVEVETEVYAYGLLFNLGWNALHLGALALFFHGLIRPRWLAALATVAVYGGVNLLVRPRTASVWRAHRCAVGHERLWECTCATRRARHPLVGVVPGAPRRGVLAGGDFAGRSPAPVDAECGRPGLGRARRLAGHRRLGAVQAGARSGLCTGRTRSAATGVLAFGPPCRNPTRGWLAAQSRYGDHRQPPRGRDSGSSLRRATGSDRGFVVVDRRSASRQRPRDPQLPVEPTAGTPRDPEGGFRSQDPCGVGRRRRGGERDVSDERRCLAEYWLGGTGGFLCRCSADGLSRPAGHVVGADRGRARRLAARVEGER